MSRCPNLIVVVLLLLLVAAPAGAGNYRQAKRIIYATFPDSTQALMFRVAGCETGFTYSPWARNRFSGAAGYFQFLPSHDGSVFRYDPWRPGSVFRGRHLVIRVEAGRLTQPWYNAKLALVMSKGGTDLSPWYASRGCWG